MSDRRRERRPSERGAFTLPAVASLAILVLVFVVVTQFAVWIYAKGALRSAVQTAARTASPIDAPAGSCELAFEHTRAQLLGGELGRGIRPVRCELGAELVTVEVVAHFDSWLPVTPGWDTTVVAVAVREREPA